MLVNSAIPALYNGISQQPDPLRLPSQADIQVNGWSTVVNGLRKRPPTQYIAALAEADLSDSYVHIINRDTTERYIVVLTNGNLEVFDLAGNHKTVTFPHGTAYLGVTDAAAQFSAVTVADYTFIINKSVTVQMQAVAADQATQPANYYGLNKALIGSQITGVPITAAQYYQMLSNPAANLSDLQGTVQSFTDLPKTTDPSPPHEGDIYEIQGDSTTDFATYYVIRSSGVWNETVKPGVQNAIDATTMPWALVRQADGTFNFAPFSWEPRRVGDETTNPNPSFVGRTLRDVFFTKNRLAFTCDENTIFSASGDYANFYRLTVTQLLADSVVDIAASQTSVTLLNFAVPFQSGILLFSDQGQYRFVYPTDGDITPTTVGIELATNYLASTTVRPVMLGSDIYFVSEDDSYAHLREYYIKQVGYLETSTTADDVSAHVPTFIPKGVYMMAGSNLHDAVFLATSADQSVLYVYQFYWTTAQQKGQSAWSYWDMGAGNKVLQAAALDDYLYFVIVRGGITYVEKMSLAQGANAGLRDNNGNLYDILLDRRINTTGTYLPAPSDFTIFNLPYSAVEANYRLVQGVGQATPGALIDPSTYTWLLPNQVKVPGNVAGNVIAGENYVFTYKFSEQFMKNQNGVAILSGRLTVRNFTVYYDSTAYFQAIVDSYGNGSYETLGYVPSQDATYSGLTVGLESLILGSPIFQSGEFTFGVFGDSKEATVTLVNDSPYQATFESAEWEADYTNRSRTI